jgi:hypothetical protein
MKLSEIREIWYVRAKISPFLPSPLNVKNLLREEVRDLKDAMQHQSQIIQNLYQTMEAINPKKND